MSEFPTAEGTAALDRAVRLSRTGDTQAGLDAARAAYRAIREQGDAALLRQAMNTLALCQAAHGLYIEAVAAAMDVQRQATAAGDRLAAAHALTTLAGASGMILDTQASELALLDHCLSEALALGDVPLECRVRNTRAIRLSALGRFEDAEADYARALELVDHAGELTRRPMLVYNMAMLALKELRAATRLDREAAAAKARERTQDAIALARAEDNPAVEARGEYTLGQVAQVLGERDTALAAFDRALSLERRLRSRSQMVNLLMARAKALAESARQEEAIAAYQKAFDEAAHHRPTPHTGAAAENLAALYRDQDAAAAARWEQVAARERDDYLRESATSQSQLQDLLKHIRPTP